MERYSNKIMLIAMDLDGTLTQHKTKLSEQTKETLKIYRKNISF